jgi:hypothetical protein
VARGKYFDTINIQSFVLIPRLGRETKGGEVESLERSEVGEGEGEDESLDPNREVALLRIFLRLKTFTIDNTCHNRGPRWLRIATPDSSADLFIGIVHNLNRIQRAILKHPPDLCDVPQPCRPRVTIPKAPGSTLQL